jgi:hypothetical protein
VEEYLWSVKSCLVCLLSIVVCASSVDTVLTSVVCALSISNCSSLVVRLGSTPGANRILT